MSPDGTPVGREFGELLRRHRMERGLSQEELAERSGLTARTIANLEHGRTARPYRRSVRSLADALTLPGPQREELERASRQITDGNPAPDLEPAGQAARPARLPLLVPRQLPGAIPHFAGRARELSALTAMLKETSAASGTLVISAIVGTAGVGKTALAVRWAHRVACHFPDGQLYLNLRGFGPSARPVPSAWAISNLLDALGVPADRIPADLDAQAGLYRSLLSGRRLLVLLDNARDSDQVRPLLPGNPGCLVVVTSRNQLAGLVAAEGAHLVRLDLLAEAEARELLVLRLGAPRVDAEPEAVAELTGLCARLPLALARAAAQLVARPELAISALVRQLRDVHERLDWLDAGDTTTSLRAVFSWSLSSLSDPAARMFRLLGLHPGSEISSGAAASLAGVSSAKARRLLDELSSAHLTAERVPGWFNLYDLLRDYAAELARASVSVPARRKAVWRLLGYYVQTGCAAALLLNPVRDRPTLSLPAPASGIVSAALPDCAQALAWYDAEHRTLLAATELAAETGLDTHAWLLCWILADFLERRARRQDSVSVQRAAMAAAIRLGDRALQARTARTLGRACTDAGDLQEARTQLHLALDLERQLGNSRGQANTHLALASLFEHLGQCDRAADHARQALGLYQVLGDQVRQAGTLNGIGWFQAHLGHYREALSACDQALDLYQQIEDRRGQASTHDSLGYIHHQLGDFPRAIACFQRALQHFQDLGASRSLATALIHLGDAYHASGDTGSTRATWQQALEILDDLHDASAPGVRAKLQQLTEP